MQPLPPERSRPRRPAPPPPPPQPEAARAQVTRQRKPGRRRKKSQAPLIILLVLIGSAAGFAGWRWFKLATATKHVDPVQAKRELIDSVNKSISEAGKDVPSANVVITS